MAVTGLLATGRVLVALSAAASLLVGLALVVVHTADGLVATTARNTVLTQLAAGLPTWLQSPDPATQPAGAVAGTVRDAAGRPLAGARVIAADARGVTYRVTADAEGRYTLAGVPAGISRVVAASTGGGPVASAIAIPTGSTQLGTLRWRPPVVVRGGATAAIDLRLDVPRRSGPTVGAHLTFGDETVVEQGPPYPGAARRRPFTLTTPPADPIVLDAMAGRLARAPVERTATGVIYAPPAGGPYPAILINYPGLPETWETVSVAIASGGFVVVAFTPLNFPDLTADVADLLYLTTQLNSGHLSPLAMPGRLCVAGGSFSTLWTFLLIQQTDAYRCVLSLGGISDAFLYREDWSAGRITPDPAMAPVPQMMAALGTPDTSPDLYLWLSVIEHTAALPPTLIVHGSGDTLVPINQSERLGARLQAEGRPHELLLYHGMAHYLDPTRSDDATRDLLVRTLDFFHRYLD
ncbi:MAG: prolyl oligopeptidase family serine peptidase [Chloroflexi bacterium]|nr:prolyl oligopeptidase family serine peptidase [Chloroflexota bacterium]